MISTTPFLVHTKAMYSKHFGLHKRPFSLTPDPEFLYLSRVHDLALTHLEYALVHPAGLVALTGEIGAGKTTLLKHLFHKAPSDIDLAMIFNTNVSAAEFLDMLVREFGIEGRFEKKSELFTALYDHFLQQYRKGRRCVIVVDESQNLPLETLEELRMLSNLEADSDFLVQIILVGQPQLRQRLTHPALAQLAQRISVYYHLLPLSEEETAQYIAHRLRVAGHSAPAQLFPDSVVAEIARVTGGVPRLVNALCDACLTYAYAEGQVQVTPEALHQVLSDNILVWNAPHPAPDAPMPLNGLVPFPAQDAHHTDDGVRELLSSLLARLEIMERRLALLEQTRSDIVDILQKMLAEERQRNTQLEKTNAVLGKMCRELKARLNEPPKPQETGTQKAPQKFWRFRFGKKI